jgi:hypothetical protein
MAYKIHMWLQQIFSKNQRKKIKVSSKDDPSYGMTILLCVSQTRISECHRYMLINNIIALKPESFLLHHFKHEAKIIFPDLM